MAALALLRSARRLQPHILLRYDSGAYLRQVEENRDVGLRQFSVFNEFSKQLKGEANSNQEFQQSVKELNEKFGNVKEDLKAKTKKTTEKLYKSIDDVWIEAEATTKKVSANVKEKLTTTKEEVSANVKEKLTAAREEVKVTFGLGKDESAGSTSTSAGPSGPIDGPNTTSGAESSQKFESKSAESLGRDDTMFGRFKSTISSASPKVSLAFQKLKEAKLSELAKKGYNIVKDELTSTPNKKRHIQYEAAAAPSGPRSTRTDIVVRPSKQSHLGEKWEAFKNKLKGHPIFKRASVLSEPVVAKGQELAEDVRERWETSDNPVVHKIQDLNDSMFSETATALCFKEIRRRDPSFSLPDFLVEVQEMVRPVLTAYHKCDLETLKKYCSSEIIERCKGEHEAFKSQGIFFENKILHISEVDVRETKLMGSSPIIIVAFQTQQIYCARDKEGLVTAGGKDTIQTVFYAWAMQQMDVEELGEGAYYPVWKLREMQQLGFQALI